VSKNFERWAKGLLLGGTLRPLVGSNLTLEFRIQDTLGIWQGRFLTGKALV